MAATKKKLIEKDAISLKFKVSYYVALPMLICAILFIAAFLFYNHVYLPSIEEVAAAIIPLRI